MSYLERWWRDSSDGKREDFKKLVKNGQLEIVGGGWVMNDEVNFIRLFGCAYQQLEPKLQICILRIFFGNWKQIYNIFLETWKIYSLIKL